MPLSISRPGKIVCVGLNYLDHAQEGGMELPKAPLLFAKWPNTLIGDGEAIVLPPESKEVDYEAELGVVIGTRAQYVSEQSALDHVAGYSIFNDGSIRDYQFKSTQWMMGKNFDATGSFGPEFVTADELPAGAVGLRRPRLQRRRRLQRARLRLRHAR